MINIAWLNKKGPQAVISFTLISSSIIIGLKLLPLPDESLPKILYAIHGSTGIAPGNGPIFLLDEDLFPHQCGRAKLNENGILSLVAYTNNFCSSSVANLRPHLLSSDLRIPWALVPTNTRVQLRKLSESSLDHMQTVALRLFRTPFFAQDYLPQIHDILGTALKQIWSAPAIQQTLLHATETIDREQASEILRGLLPIISEHGKQNFWRTLRISISAIMGSQSQAQQEAIGQLVTEILSDPRIGEHLSNTLPPLLASSSSIAIGIAVIREAINGLLTDPRLQELVLRLFTDRRFLRLRPIGTDAEQLFTTLPNSLMRMRHRKDHNPLVSYVLRAIMRGQQNFLVLMLSPEQEQQLSHRNLPPEPTLNRVQ